jgi:SAM-dependent methyltransferase
MRQDTTLDLWESVFQNQTWGKYPPIPLVRFIAKHFHPVRDRSELRVLELGSGPGANLWFLAREGFTVYGIDGSETACRLARQRLEEENLRERIGELLVGDYFEHLKYFPDEFFDAVIDIESLYCNSFERSRKIMKSVFQKLKKNGKFFSMTFAENSYGFEKGNEIDYHAILPTDGPMAGKGFSRFTTKSDIYDLYEHENSKIINIQRQDLILDETRSIKEWIIEAEKR